VATYEYVCLACERHFEQRRAMAASVETALACPVCGSDRVRRQFSFLAGSAPRGFDAPAAGGCACGGACACGH
jgi:putative FmdB family regulatory protein